MPEAFRACVERRALTVTFSGVVNLITYLASPALPAGYWLRRLCLLHNGSSNLRCWFGFALAGSRDETAENYAAGTALFEGTGKQASAPHPEFRVAFQNVRTVSYEWPLWRLVTSGPKYVVMRLDSELSAIGHSMSMTLELERWAEVYMPRGPNVDGSE